MRPGEEVWELDFDVSNPWDRTTRVPGFTKMTNAWARVEALAALCARILVGHTLVVGLADEVLAAARVWKLGHDLHVCLGRITVPLRTVS